MVIGYLTYLYIILPRSEFRTTAKQSHVILLFYLFWFSHFWQPAYLARKFHQNPSFLAACSSQFSPFKARLLSRQRGGSGGCPIWILLDNLHAQT